MQPAFRVKEILRERALWALTTLILLFFRRPLLGETFYFRDLWLLFIPQKVFMARAFREGSIPLWNPTLHGGLPYAGDPANFFFHPSTLLYTVLDPLTAFNLTLVGSYLAMAVATYLLVRSLGLSPSSAFIGGATMTLSGFALSVSNLVPILLALPCFPLHALALHRLVTERRSRWLALAALAGALPLLSGAAEMTILIGLSSVAWIFLTDGSLSAAARTRALAGAWCFSFALSCVILLPASELIARSGRSSKLPYATFASWSVAPQRLPELVIPYYFGFTDQVDARAYWGRFREDKGAPYIISIHVGILSLLFAAAARRTDRVPRRLLAALALLATAGLALSLGRHLPGFELGHRYVPLVSTFRYPVKALALAVLPLALLAAAGADRLLRDGDALLDRVATAACLVAGIVTAILAASPALLHSTEALAFGSAGWATQDATLLAGSGLLAFYCGAVALASWWNRRRGGALPQAVLCALVFGSLACAGHRVNDYGPREIFAKPLHADLVARVARDGRLYRAAVPDDLEVPAASNAFVARWHLESLHRYTAPLGGVPVVFHEDFDGLAPRNITTMTQVIERLGWPARVAILRSSGVTAVASETPIAAPGLEHVASLRTPPPVAFELYSLVGASGARVTCASVTDPDPDNAFRALLRREVVAPAVAITATGARKVTPPCEASLLERTSTINSSRQRVRLARDGYLVLSQTYYPGWTATVDGRPAPTVRADFAFTAVPVPAGEHIVDLRYRPRLLFAGAGISVVALVALLLCARLDLLKLRDRLATVSSGE